MINSIIIPKYKKPSQPGSQNNVYTHKELNQFLECAKDSNLTTYTYFKLLASTGMRKSEALALLWKDINFKEGYININKTLARSEDNHTTVNKPKTQNSIRKVPLSDNIRSILEKYKLISVPKNNIIFCTRQGKYYTPNAPNYWLKAVYDKNPSTKVTMMMLKIL